MSLGNPLGNPFGNPLGLPKKTIKYSSELTNAGFFNAPPSEKWVLTANQTIDIGLVYGDPWNTFEQSYAFVSNGFGSATGNCVAVASSPDGAHVAFLNSSKTVNIFAAGADPMPLVASLPLAGTLGVSANASLAYSGDSSILAVPITVSPWVSLFKRSGDTYNALAASLGLSAQPLWMAFSKNGKYFATSSGGTISVFKRSGDSFTFLINITPSAGTVLVFDFSADGKFIAAAHTATPFLTVWSINDSDVFTPLSPPAILPDGASSCVSFSPDSTLIAVTSNGNVGSRARLYSVATGSVVLFNNLGLTSAVRGCKFSPNGQFLALVGTALTTNSGLLRINPPEFIKLGFGPSDTVASLDWSMDSNVLFCPNNSSAPFSYGSFKYVYLPKFPNLYVRLK